MMPKSCTALVFIPSLTETAPSAIYKDINGGWEN